MKTKSSPFALIIAAALLLVVPASWAQQLDYGDFSGFSPASSQVVGNLKMGATIDADDDSLTGGVLQLILNLLTNSSATTDNTTGLNDEDGATVPSGIASTSTFNSSRERYSRKAGSKIGFPSLPGIVSKK